MGLRDWRPPADWPILRSIDAHTEGEPFRVITEGFPKLEGASILDKRREARERHDALRRRLMWEPRGHADMYGGLVCEPSAGSGADFAILFLHNAGFSTMCGHGIIAIATVAVEVGLLAARRPETPMLIEAPAGLIRARAVLGAEGVDRVAFANVPSFVLDRGARIEVDGLGELRYDLAFGGAFYAFVAAEDIGLTGAADEVGALIDAGRRIKAAIAAARPVPHPVHEDLSFLYGVIFTAPAREAERHSRHICVFADGEVDRSPTGTGVSARLALLADDGLAIGEDVVIESIIGSRFRGRILEETRFGPHRAVIPEVEGRAFITGQHAFVIDPRDPLGDGFFLR